MPERLSNEILLSRVPWRQPLQMSQLSLPSDICMSAPSSRRHSNFIITRTACFIVLFASFFNVVVANRGTCESYNIQLYGGKTLRDGRVVVQDNRGNWNSACFTWGIYDYRHRTLVEWKSERIAQVLCNQLGFRHMKGTAIFYEYPTGQPLANSTVTLMGMKCEGNENHISECNPHSGEIHISTYRHLSSSCICFSGIACGRDSLFKTSLQSLGFMNRATTLFMNETRSIIAAGIVGASSFGWSGGVCSHQWDLKNLARIARVACHEMYSSLGVSIRKVNAALQSLDEVGADEMPGVTCLMTETTCTGYEQSIDDCHHQNFYGPLTSDREFMDAWYGHDVPIACLNNSWSKIHLTSGRQLSNSSSSNSNSVFIKYDDNWLPVISSSSPNTCRAICNTLYKDGPTTALCYGQAVGRVLRESNGYFASIYCNSNETTVDQCAHEIQFVNVDDSFDMEEIQDQLLVAECLPLKNDNTSMLEIELQDTPLLHPRKASNIPDNSSVIGCILITLESGERHWATALALEDAQAVATAMCKSIYPNDNRYASYVTFENYPTTIAPKDLDPELDSDWQSDYERESQLIFLRFSFIQRSFPKASATIGCPPNATSIADCAFLLVPQRENYQESLRLFGVICAAEKSVIRVNATSSILGHDWLVELKSKNFQALVNIAGWNDIAADVVCREQNLRDAPYRAIRKAWLMKSSMLLMTNVSCTGSEKSLLECKHAWNSGRVPIASYVAGVTCGHKDPQVSVSFIPFINRPKSGYATITEKTDLGIRRTLFPSWLETPFEWVTAISICRASGFKRTKRAEFLSISGKQLRENLNNDSDTVLTDFACNDKSSPLEECNYRKRDTIEIYGTDWESAASPVLVLGCDEYELGTIVRLVGGETPYEGHVEVMYRGEWGGVCDDRFEDTASMIICRQLFGPSSQGKAVFGSKFPAVSERYLLDDVRCYSSAKSLAECEHSVWGNHDCGPCEQAGVICTPVNFIHQPWVTLKAEGEKLQLTCAAEGQPPPSYQWFTTGATSVVSGDRVYVDCNDSDSVRYICNAFNDAGESFVHVFINREVSCYNETNHSPEKSFEKASQGPSIVAMAVGLGILLVMLIGAIWTIFSLRRSLNAIQQPMGNDLTNSSYIVLNEAASSRTLQ